MGKTFKLETPFPARRFGSCGVYSMRVEVDGPKDTFELTSTQYMGYRGTVMSCWRARVNKKLTVVNKNTYMAYMGDATPHDPDEIR